MAWGNKEREWKKLVADIQSEIDANVGIIPPERLNDIQHYLDHDEYSMAFEYLYLEVMEHANARFILGPDKAREMAIFFDLDDENECVIDHEFWPKFEAFLNAQKNTS